MPGFLYFIPGVSSISSVSQLAEWGISHAFEAPGRKTPQPSAGPDGLSGLLLTDPDRVDPGRAAYVPKRQVWRRHAKGYYVGMEKDVVLTPADLQRRKLIDGSKPVQLGDEQTWQVPVARRWAASDDGAQARYQVMLERTITVFDGQVVFGNVLRRHAELWAISVAWYHHCAGPDDNPEDEEAERQLFYDDAGTLSLAQLIGCAARVLAANYVIGVVEASMLGLFTSENWQNILHTLIGYEDFVAIMQKKSERIQGELTSSAGPGVTSPITGLPSPKSSRSAEGVT